MKRLFFTAILALSATSLSQASTPILNIVRGAQDTVSKPRHIIVATTTPGGSASINGKKLHVYNTGAFGDTINLHEGDNTITLSATINGKTIHKTINVYLKASQAAQYPQPAANDSLLSSPLFLETRPGAYLQYGNGNDRLGGSKMGYINEGIIVKAIGECGELYKIKLSQNRFAYIPKEYTETSAGMTSTVNTGSISITNEGNVDVVSISLPHRLPYRSWTQLDPTTICVELFGATNNTNWLTQRGTLGIIDYVDLQQCESDVLKAVIKLKHEYSWGYSTTYDGNNLKIAIKHTPKLNLSNLTIGLDAGHGGEYPGAISATGITENEVNLDIVLRVAKLLEAKGANVILSREGDSGPTMSQRKQTFLDGNVDLMLSIHNNSGGSPFTEMGTSTYYKHICNRALAECLLNRMLELGLKNFGLTGNFNFSLNSPTEYPNALLEVLFMSSLPEEEKLADPEFRQQVALKVVLALEDYLNLVKNESLQ